MSLLELLKQKKQDMQASKRKRAAKIPDGKSRWRVLPSWRGEGKQFWHDFGQHFIKDATGAMAAVYVCTERTYGRPCEICSTVAGAIKAAADDATMKLLSDAKAAQRVLVNAIHLDGPNPNEVVVMELAPSLFEQIVAIAAEWEEADQSIFDVKGGKELILERKGTGKQTEYSAQVAAANKFKVPADVLTKLNDLDEYVKQESSEQAQRALNSAVCCRRRPAVVRCPRPQLVRRRSSKTTTRMPSRRRPSVPLRRSRRKTQSRSRRSLQRRLPQQPLRKPRAPATPSWTSS
jgi:hypothetical protein